ncbi:MAG: hypothetical protein HGA36_00145 [Candidatus Moranbacteria bacterium]|nr:hypothetical protein [Candidatus Moranbacteria bacterium]
MLVPLFQILYFLVFFVMLLISIFIVFHIVFYAYSFFSKLLMLAIFVPVAGVLLFTNFLSFSAIDLRQVFAGLI